MRIISRHLRLHLARRCRGSTRSRSPATTCRRPGRRADLELAYTLADGVEYLRAGMAAGLDVDAFAPRLSFFWAIGMNFFMEVAKLRAARLLWAQAGQDQFGADEPQVAVLRTHSPDLAAGRSPRRTSSTTSCAPASRRWPPPRATPSRCTPTPSTRRSRCPPTSRPASPATPSCCCSRSRAPPGSSTRGAAATYVERLTARPGRAGLAAHRGGRGGRRHGQGDRGRHPQAAHRGGRGAHPGPHRLRPAAGHRRQQATASTSDEPIDVLQGRQRRGARRASSPSSSGCAPSATRTPRRRRCNGSRMPPAPVPTARSTPTCWRSPSTRPGRRRRSVRSRPRWRRSTAGTRPRSVRSRACTAPRRASDETVHEARRWSSEFEKAAGPPAAHPRRQDGPGRPRPRPEGHRHGLRRPRLRRRRRPAVPDAGRGRAPGGRGRRARRRRQLAGRRAPHPGAGAAGRARRARPPGHHDRRRRRHPAPGLRRRCAPPAPPRSSRPARSSPTPPSTWSTSCASGSE